MEKFLVSATLLLISLAAPEANADFEIVVDNLDVTAFEFTCTDDGASAGVSGP